MISSVMRHSNRTVWILGGVLLLLRVNPAQLDVWALRGVADRVRLAATSELGLLDKHPVRVERELRVPRRGGALFEEEFPDRARIGKVEACTEGVTYVV